jgi:dTDP-L-rhamnose 4-epimerase
MLANACKKTAQIVETDIYRAGDILACTANISKSKSLLGYLPKVSLQNGITEFANWAKKQNSIDQYECTVNELAKHNLIGNLLCTTK